MNVQGSESQKLIEAIDQLAINETVGWKRGGEDLLLIFFCLAGATTRTSGMNPRKQEEVAENGERKGWKSIREHCYSAKKATLKVLTDLHLIHFTHTRSSIPAYR